MVVEPVWAPSVVVVVAVVGSGPVVGAVVASPELIVVSVTDAEVDVEVEVSVAEANPLVVAAGPPPQARSAHSGSVVIAAGTDPVIRAERDIACSSGLAQRERGEAMPKSPCGCTPAVLPSTHA